MNAALTLADQRWRLPTISLRWDLVFAVNASQHRRRISLIGAS
jgi:hypothetical protein